MLVLTLMSHSPATGAESKVQEPSRSLIIYESCEHFTGPRVISGVTELRSLNKSVPAKVN